jgi:hypothetical protein
MPIDQTIEAISNSFFSFVLWLLPTSVISKSVSVYLSTTETIHTIYSQVCKTTGAIRESFDSPLLAFFKYNNTHLPIVVNTNAQYSTLPSWVYTVESKEFTIPNTEEIQIRPFRLPFLSATLIHKKNGVETVLGDMSEWIGEQTVYAPDGTVPLQVLVGAWMYSKEPPTLLMSYDDLFLKTMNEMAEEQMYYVLTEKEVEEGEIPETPETLAPSDT